MRKVIDSIEARYGDAYELAYCAPSSSDDGARVLVSGHSDPTARIAVRNAATADGSGWVPYREAVNATDLLMQALAALDGAEAALTRCGPRSHAVLPEDDAGPRLPRSVLERLELAQARRRARGEG
jgi:hypothetical protein